MACLEAGPLAQRDVFGLLAADLGLGSEVSPDLAERLQGIVDDFASLGWIEPAP